MRAHEFVIEGKKGQLDKNTKRAMHKTHAYGDGYRTDGAMNFYRVGMAAAMADGGDHPVDIDERTWFSTNNVAVPYSDLEHKMMHQAFKSVKSNVKNPVSDHRSQEAEGTNRTSPVRSKSRNKYGV
jgi:hypothetical protein